MTDPHHALDGLDAPADMDESRPPPNPLLTMAEAARYTGVSVTTLKKWVDEGLPTVSMPGTESRIRVRLSDLDKFIESRRS